MDHLFTSQPIPDRHQSYIYWRIICHPNFYPVSQQPARKRGRSALWLTNACTNSSYLPTYSIDHHRNKSTQSLQTGKLTRALQINKNSNNLWSLCVSVCAWPQASYRFTNSQWFWTGRAREHLDGEITATEILQRGKRSCCNYKGYVFMCVITMGYEESC